MRSEWLIIILKMRKAQQHIESTLQANKIDYEIKDIAASQFDKIKMRSYANDQKALPPQIVNKHHYCGVSQYMIFNSMIHIKLHIHILYGYMAMQGYAGLCI